MIARSVDRCENVGRERCSPRNEIKWNYSTKYSTPLPSFQFGTWCRIFVSDLFICCDNIVNSMEPQTKNIRLLTVKSRWFCRIWSNTNQFYWIFRFDILSSVDAVCKTFQNKILQNNPMFFEKIYIYRYMSCLFRQ